MAPNEAAKEVLSVEEREVIITNPGKPFAQKGSLKTEKWMSKGLPSFDRR